MHNEELRPNLDTVRFFESEGMKYRLYVTVGGGVACEGYNERSGEWSHMPLRMASEQELSEILVARYETQDEEIARQLGNVGG